MDSNTSSGHAGGGYPPYYPPTNYQQSYGQQQQQHHSSNQPSFPSRSSSSSPLIGHPSSSTYRGPLSQPLLPSPSPSASPPHNHFSHFSKSHPPSSLPPKPTLHSSSSTDSSSSSLQRRLAESEAARATLEATNASPISEREKKDAKLAQFIEERKRVKKDEEEFSEALALDHQAQITRLEEEKAVLKEQVDELGDELEGSKKGREEATRGLRKRVEQLEKKLSLKARENDTLRGELSSEARRYESLLEERGISVDEGKTLELEKALQAGRELKRELEEARESEKELRDALEAKDREIARLGEEKESIAAALQESESERTKQMDQFSAFSASFQSFNKRPLDASSSSSSRASQPPQKKAKFKDGMPKTKAERTAFIDYWLATLFEKRSEERICLLCQRLNAKSPSAIPTKPLKFELNVAQSEALLGKALLGHLETSHGPGWKKICAGLEEKK